MAVVKGTLHLKSANRCADKMIASVIQFHATRVLIDCRDLKGPFSTTDRFLHTDYISETILTALSNNQIKGFRIAYFAHPQILDPHRFGETVARNRGVEIFVTESWTEATEWLGVNIPGSTLSR